jgi:hypothetical protein
VDGTLTENAFLKLRFSQEMSIVFAKLRPILKDLRGQTDNPDFMANMEKVILTSANSRKRLQLELRRQATLRKTH